jgi:hypothetical protein
MLHSLLQSDGLNMILQSGLLDLKYCRVGKCNQLLQSGETREFVIRLNSIKLESHEYLNNYLRFENLIF